VKRRKKGFEGKQRSYVAWIADRIGKLNHLLATRTEKSALALRRLTGAITLSLSRSGIEDVRPRRDTAHPGPAEYRPVSDG
jgi:hypothetical protein